MDEQKPKQVHAKSNPEMLRMLVKNRDRKKMGRATVMTEETVQKLEMAFKVGCTDDEACFYADISRQTLYNYAETHPDFIDKKNLWKTRPVLKARQVVVNALEQNDLGTARWYLERKDPDLGNKVKMEHSGDITNNVIHSLDTPEMNALREEYEKRMYALTAEAWEKPQT